MRLLFIGDVVGQVGQHILAEQLPIIKTTYHPQLTIVNGENITKGKGMIREHYKAILQAGADVITMGNHTFDKQDLFEFIEQAPKLVRPANFPVGTPGQGFCVVQVNQHRVGVINLQGRVFMDSLDDPFRKADELIAQLQGQCELIVVDFHAETTSEKLAMAFYLDGRVTAVVGTHTHVQTNDARLLPKGTAYLTDAGMTGPYDEILGTKKELVIDRFLSHLPVRFETPETGRAQLNGCLIEVGEASGKARKIEPIHITPEHPFLR